MVFVSSAGEGFLSLIFPSPFSSISFPFLSPSHLFHIFIFPIPSSHAYPLSELWRRVACARVSKIVQDCPRLCKSCCVAAGLSVCGGLGCVARSWKAVEGCDWSTSAAAGNFQQQEISSSRIFFELDGVVEGCKCGIGQYAM